IPVLADDSGLIVPALDGAPGIYSARYACEQTDDQANNALLLKNMIDLKGDERKAHFICVLAIARPDEETQFFTGYCEGTIANETTGTNGFGYDPLFIPKGHCQTMAELDSHVKNDISHRSVAIRLLGKDLTTLFFT